ncbi:MAG TPA: recombination regulator RecX [Castellaniella sp.]|nr:recombination regulator RecX [Castellaniella sp.]
MASDSPARRGLSLKARAIAYLSRREHSRLELQRKLSAHCDDPDQVQAVLNELAAAHWQSDQRYAESYVVRQAPRQGALRIVQALRMQGVNETDLLAIKAELAGTEIARAREVWAHKYAQAPADAREYARQFRFMASRGFSPEAIHRILGGRDDSFD